jgi:uncharacterized protein
VIVRADDLRPEGLPVDLTLDVGPLSYEESIEIQVGATTLAARVRPSRGGVVCAGRIEAVVSVPCSRCLAYYSLPVDREFDVSYLPEPSAGQTENIDLRVSREDLDVSYLDSEGKLDMRELATEQIYLALPMKPLCAPECRGLCSGCGSNLNAETCRCVAAAR